jgi:hypothetical protein
MRKSVRNFIILLFTWTFFRGVFAGECEKTASYQIHVTLDEKSKILTGSETIVWKNTGQATDEIYLHLYLNAFKNNQSTFMQETARRFADTPDYFASIVNGGWGYCDLASVFVESPNAFSRTDVSRLLKFTPIDDGNTADETVARIQLPAMVASGSLVTLDINFISKLPHRAPRTGWHVDFIFAGQWFPKVGVWMNNQWDCHQFHANTEFFADYGDYDVSITLPKNYIVGASGIQAEEHDDGNGAKTVRFRQECIHDFAWTASPRFKVAERAFQSTDLPPVTMRLLYQPGHEKYVNRFFDATANTINYFGLWYAPYPYPQITIVDAAHNSNVAGMEYPTLFNTGVDWLEASGSQEPLGLTVHECGHQWFYGLIGSNEFEDAWLDEGFTVYATSRCMDIAYGPGSYSKTYLQRNGFGIPWTFSQVVKDQRDWIVQNNRERGNHDKMGKFAWEYVDRFGYRNNAYEKPALMLWTLENVLGETVFNRIMSTYTKRYSFKHPKPQDFINVVNEFAPQDMSGFFEQMLNGYGVLDYAVVQVASREKTAADGYFGSDDSLKIEKKEKSKAWLSQIHVERKGAFIMPVELLVTFEDGEKVRENWDGRESYKIFYYTHKTAVEKAEIDPDHKIWLDVDPGNNGRYRQANGFAALRWGAQWLFWLQHFLEITAIFS